MEVGYTARAYRFLQVLLLAQARVTTLLKFHPQLQH